MPKKKAWYHLDFVYVVKVLTFLYKAEQAGRALTTTDLVIEGGIPSSTFYTSVRPSMEEAGLIKVETNPEARAMIVKLTDKGRKLAECLSKCTEMIEGI